MGTIFLSYPRAQNELASELRTHLASSFGTYEIFKDDQRIQVGEDWGQALFTALDDTDILVALLTPEWKLSKWCQEEWRRAEGKLRVPVLGTPWHYDGDDIARWQIARTTDGGAFSEVEHPTRRQREWADLMGRIRQAIAASHTSIPQRPELPPVTLPPLPGFVPTRGKKKAAPTAVLSLRGRRDGDDVAWTACAAGVEVGWRSPLAALPQVPADLTSLSGEAQAKGLGRSLLAWLWDGANRSALWRALFGPATPEHAGFQYGGPIRLRVSLPPGVRLPLSLLCDGDQYLLDTGWTVEHGEGAGEGVTFLESPCNVLLLAPRRDDLGASAHLERIRGLLERAWGEVPPGRIRRAASREELAELRRWPVDLLYVFAPTTPAGLVLDGPTGTEVVGNLADYVGEPALTWMATIGPALSRVPGRCRAELSTRVPAHATDVALRFLDEVIVQGVDPGQALATSGDLVGRAAVLHASHADFRVGAPPQGTGSEVELDFDRSDPKKLTAGYLDELVASKNFHALCLLVELGATGQRRERLGDALVRHLVEERAKVWVLRRRNAGEGGSLAAVARANLTPSAELSRELGKKPAVECVDWGHPEGDAAWWKDWASAARTSVAGRHPHHKVLHFATVTPGGPVDQDWADTHEDQLLMVRLIPEPRLVRPGDVRHYLNRVGGCPRADIDAVCRAVAAESKGRFDVACDLLADGRRDGYVRLARLGAKLLESR